MENKIKYNSKSNSIIYNTTNTDKINGVLLGLLISSDLLIKLINLLLPIDNLLPIYYIAIILITFMVNKKIINTVYGLVFFLINFLFIISFYRVQDSSYTFQYFVYFNAIYLSTGILQFRYNLSYTFHSINISNILYSLFLLFYAIPGYQNGVLNPNDSMGYSYTAIIGIAAFLFSLNKYNEKRIFFIINSVSVLIEIYFILFVSFNRGSLLALSIVFIFYFLLKTKNKNSRYTFILILGFIISYIYNNLLNILGNLIKIFNIIGIHSTPLSRLISSIENENLSTGRELLYEKALNLFWDSPLIGNGIGNFASVNNGAWPHNIFLEIITDQGVLILIIFILLIFYFFKKLFTNPNSEYTMFASFLFVISIPRLSLSSLFWQNTAFWLFIVFTILNINKKANL